MMSAAPPQATSVKNGEATGGTDHGHEQRETKSLTQFGALAQTSAQHSKRPRLLLGFDGIAFMFERGRVVEAGAVFEQQQFVVDRSAEVFMILGGVGMLGHALPSDPIRPSA